MSTVSPQLEFVGWERPCLHLVVERLAQRFVHDGLFDLSSKGIVLPGGKALRRFTELLVDAAEAQSLTLLPPKLITVGQIPEIISGATPLLVTETEIQLLWAAVLREFPEQELKGLVPSRPEESDLGSWLSLAERVDSLNREISGAGLTFEQALTLADELPDFVDAERWEILQQLSERYHQKLHELGLQDTHTARAEILAAGEIHPLVDELFLVATVDLNQVSRNFISLPGVATTAFIPAPESMRTFFDSFGTVNVEAWQNHPLSIPLDMISVVQSPRDAAEEVIQFLRSASREFSIDEVAVGIADDSDLPFLQEALESRDIPVRSAQGVPFSQIAPIVFLEVAARFIQSNQYVDLAALIRHPDVERWFTETILPATEALASSPDILSILDRHQIAHLQAELPEKPVGKPVIAGQMLAIQHGIRTLLEPLSKRALPLSEWRKPIIDVLNLLYTRTGADDSELLTRQVREAAEGLDRVFSELRENEPIFSPPVSSGQAISFFLHRLRSEETVPEPAIDSVELLGWLELPLDDAACVVLTGMHEQAVPGSVNSDVILPNTLRRKLGLLDNDRRYARDAFSLSTIVHSRRRVHIVLARQNAEHEQRLPSRLLVSSRSDELAQRVSRLYDHGKRCELPKGDRPNSRQVFVAPQPLPAAALTEMNVTDFRRYLQCPYRFYLKRVMRLESIDDDALEMDRRLFGTFAHEILNAFAKSDYRESTDAQDIQKFFSEIVMVLAGRQFGRQMLPAVAVQLQQLRMRLNSFAQWQAAWAKQGWRIEDGEREFRADKVQLDFPGGSMGLRGKIDRIDFHPVTGQFAIFDYKTGDTQTAPQKTHCRGEEWLDLQLPLYEYALRQLGVDADIRLGYLVLPQTALSTHDVWADWSGDRLGQAVECARTIAQKVAAQEFWPPSKDRFPDDEFAWIVGAGIADDDAAEAGDEPE